MNTLSFFIPIKNEVDRLAALLPNLRSVYPNERVILYSNGSDSAIISGLNNYSQRYNTEIFSNSGSVYLHNNAGQIFRDLINVYNESPTDYLIRLDSDCNIYSPLTGLESYSDSIFGCVHSASGISAYLGDKIFIENESNNQKFFLTMPTYVNGVIGYSSGALNQFIQNNSFDPSNDDSFYQSYCDFRSDRGSPTASGSKISIDYVLSHVASELNIPLLDHPQIYSVCIQNPDVRPSSYISNILLDTTATQSELNNSGKYSIVHPVGRYLY